LILHTQEVKKLNFQQRTHIADKITDTANLALAGIVFAQISQEKINISLFGGILALLLLWSYSVYLLKERKI
jgi:hypothetical protein